MARLNPIRAHIKKIRDEAIEGADAKRRATLRELAEFALLFEAANRHNVGAMRRLGKELKRK